MSETLSHAIVDTTVMEVLVERLYQGTDHDSWSKDYKMTRVLVYGWM